MFITNFFHDVSENVLPYNCLFVSGFCDLNGKNCVARFLKQTTENFGVKMEGLKD
jgi:hypothetical protein